MVQERHLLSKAFKSEISFKMQKNKKLLILFILLTFPYVGFSLSKLAVIFLPKSGKIEQIRIVGPFEKLSLKL